MTEKSFPTRLINNTKRPVMVFETDGPLVELQPGQAFEVESRNSATMYSRWLSVTWHEGGEITFVDRPGFTEPERGRWVIRFLNQDGEAVERRVVAGRPLILPRGIPVLVGLKLDDPLVRFKSMSVVKKRVMLKDSEHDGYCIFKTVVKDETEPRSDSELRVLAKLLVEQ